jgi:predicted secreted hydrolase
VSARSAAARRGLAGAALLALAALGGLLLRGRTAVPPEPERVASAEPTPQSAEPNPGWQGARPGFPWSFPRDHWVHPQFRSEWWYFTGHLAAQPAAGVAAQSGASAPRFGYQFTFFRVGLLPEAPPLDSAWSARALLMGHAALADLERGEHRFSELLYRAVPLLAGFEAPGTGPRIAWSRAPQGTDGRWELGWNGEGFDFRMRDDAKRIAFELRTRPRKPLVLQGPGGLSSKSSRADAASLYYSFTRLETSGHVEIDGERHAVSGESWMDKELSSQQLAADQSGWDWFSLQLDDGRELMLYVLRGREGAVSHARATWVERDGSARYLGPEAWTLQARAHWTSAASGIRYPAGWSLQLPELGLQLRLEPALADQENRSRLGAGPTYWEGAIRVLGPDGAPLGRGYAELTGYGENNRPPL